MKLIHVIGPRCHYPLALVASLYKRGGGKLRVNMHAFICSVFFNVDVKYCFEFLPLLSLLIDSNPELL